MSLTPFAVLWGILALVVLGLAMWRNLAELHEDDTLHLSRGSEMMVAQQVAMGGMLHKLDHWGKLLTAITVVSGLALGSAYLYQAIFTSTQLMR